jgi:hypothetical protein
MPVLVMVLVSMLCQCQRQLLLMLMMASFGNSDEVRAVVVRACKLSPSASAEITLTRADVQDLSTKASTNYHISGNL